MTKTEKVVYHDVILHNSLPLNQNNPLFVLHKMICKSSFSSLLECKCLESRDRVSCIFVSSASGWLCAGHRASAPNTVFESKK